MNTPILVETLMTPETPPSDNPQNPAGPVPRKKSVRKAPPVSSSPPQKEIKRTNPAVPLPQKTPATHSNPVSVNKPVRPVSAKSPEPGVPPSPQQNSPESASGVVPEKTELRKKMRRRGVRSDTISKIYYRIAQKRRFHWFLLRSLLVLLPIAGMVVCIQWYWNSQKRSQDLIQSSEEGVTALSQDNFQKATQLFQNALDLYSSYHTTGPQWWWYRDAPVFHAMLRIAQGWRSLGIYQKAIQTFQEIARHNTAGPDSWVGNELETNLLDFIDPVHWSTEQRRTIYELFLQIPPAKWKRGDIHLIHCTERLGLQLVPMEKRIKDADLIIYGTPLPMDSPQDISLNIEGLFYYKIDRLPERDAVQIPPGSSIQERERWVWYSQSGRKCLIFVKQQGSGVTLLHPEDIVLCEPYSVDEFNHFYRE